GLDARTRLEIATADTAAAFNPGRVSATLLPLRIPTSGKVTLALTGNTTYDLASVLSDLGGTTSPSDTLRVGSPTKRIRWSFGPSPSGAAFLDTSWTTLEAGTPAATAEAPVPRDLYLWIDHPASLPPQDYRGRLSLRLEPRGVAGATSSRILATTATIVGAGQAADSAVAEVLPHAVTAGGTQTVTAYLLPVFRSGDT